MASGIQKYTVVESNNLALGQAGLDVLATDANEAGTWIAIKALGGDIPIDAVTVSNGDALTSFTISQGDIIYGTFTNIEVGTVPADARCLAYRG